jgi:FAD:protein FMN transferase
MEQRIFRAMGTDCHVLVSAPDAECALVDLAQARVELLEQAWSRFRPTSELTRLNLRAGTGPVEVSGDLLALLTRMQQAWALTDGLFDPTVLSSMTSLGYDADFATVAARTIPAADVVVTPAPGMSRVVVDPAASTVQLPLGVGIDPGAIGKGLAADMIVEELRMAGATAVLVSLGGDISVGGRLDEPWLLAIEDHGISDVPACLIDLPTGTDRAGIATSTTAKRRWASGRRHHVIDPRTGTMAQSDIVQTTVAAESAWRAEVLATTALLADADAAELLPASVWCRIVRTDGSVDMLGSLDSISTHDTDLGIPHYTTLEALHG